MGAQQGKRDQRQSTLLTDSECQQLTTLFSRIKGSSTATTTPASSRVRAEKCQKQAFQDFCSSSLDNWLSERISLEISSGGSDEDASISIRAFLQLVSTVLKGDLDENIGFIYSICCGTEGRGQKLPSQQMPKTILGSRIIQFSNSLVKSYVKSFHDTPPLKSWLRFLPVDQATNTLAIALLQDLLYPQGPPKNLINQTADYNSREFTLDELISGISKSMLFRNMFSSIFSKCFEFNMESGVIKNIVPNCLHVQPTLLPIQFTLLDLNRVIFLNSLIPPDHRSKWRFLFSSAAHGESFSKFLSTIQQKGATVIIIQDNRDRIFGGFAPASWKLGPKFFGTSQSFLFHLSPRMLSYSATGYNEHFQYLNIGQKTLPNGLGMGGTLEYFGLWIDSEYGKGLVSPSCTTYNCPQLSVDKEFVITHLEAWGVGPEPEKEEGVREPQSILDKDPELRAVLEIMGKKVNASDGHRELPPETD